MTLTDRIKAAGRDLGLSMVAVAPAVPSPQLDAYLRWIEAEMHGTMSWMARQDRVIRRQDPTVILPDAQSFVIAALDYHTNPLPPDIANDPARGRFSNYAWKLDYHDIMLPRLMQLAAFIERASIGNVACRAYVDTGAILERSLGVEAGLGFTGKNTMLIHPQRGSFFFLGEIITTAYLEHDEPLISKLGCGTCTRCLVDCPTDAFPQPYVLDARRCISYLTIEHPAFIPREFRPKIGNWVYGCDVCQDICPWQRFTETTVLPEQFAMSSLNRAAPHLSDLLTLDEAGFAEMFAGSPVKRIGHTRFIRNACVAAGNSDHRPLVDALISLLDDAEPLIRGHAAWALGTLDGSEEALRRAMHNEDDAEVEREIRWALDSIRL